MSLFGTGYDPTVPGDNEPVSEGAGHIRSLKQLLLDFLSVSFNLETGAILAAAVPNPVTTPYGAAGTIYTSTGPSTPPAWAASPSVPVGGMMMWPTASAPSGYLLCNGSTQLITTYTALATVLGTTFGGDGVTTFGLPDFRGRSPIGVGTGTASDATAWALAEKGGTETHTLATPQIPSHVHNIDWTPYSGQHQNGSQGAGVYPIVSGVSNTDTESTGGGEAHPNMHPVLGINIVIKT